MSSLLSVPLGKIQLPGFLTGILCNNVHEHLHEEEKCKKETKKRGKTKCEAMIPN
jgi:hypothetical protein